MSMPNLSLDGKVAVVTGSSRGIGKAIASVFAEAGADVVICSRGIGKELETAADEIREYGRRCLAIPCDISQKAAINNLVNRTIDEFGVIDILVNNAATIVRKLLVDHSEEEWDTVVDTNLKGYYLCSQSVAKTMIKQNKGNIINISSIRGISPNPGRASYCVSKSGIIMLTRVMALELARYNIRVNAIAPGWVYTEINEPLFRDPKIFCQIETEVPLGRYAMPDEIANIALFLVSDASSYITGHTIVADGGLVP